jgi:4-hydroxy-tetrahydrodipicolinate synthase
MSTDFKGVFSALTTPFAADGSIDEIALRESVSFAIEKGVDGFAPCGSTGEFTSLTERERMLVTEVVIETAAGRVPVVPHTGALTTAEAVRISRHAAQSGAAGVLAIIPFYEPIELDDVRGYYEALCDAVSVPVGVYNLPQASGVNLDPDWVGELAAELEPLAFIKESTGDYTQLGRLVRDHGESLTVFNGADTLLLAAFELGAAAAIIGAPNIAPAECAAVFDAFSEGRHEDAVAAVDDIYELLQVLLSGAYYPALVKAGLEIVGRPAGEPRKPVLPIRGERREALARILARTGAGSLTQ